MMIHPNTKKVAMRTAFCSYIATLAFCCIHFFPYKTPLINLNKQTIRLQLHFLQR